jgi:hypothetical protein
MTNATPFFKAFGPLLFGRPKPNAIRDLLGKVSTATSLNDLQQMFGHFIPEALLSRARKDRSSRDRLFTVGVTFWAFLAQVISKDSSCRDALLRILAWWKLQLPGSPLPSTDNSAYCKARCRLGEDKLDDINSAIALKLERNVPERSLYRKRRVKVVDGTCLSMPDTPDNQKQWPQSRQQKPGCGFPILKLVGVFSLASGALLHIAHGSKHVHESRLFRTLWDCLEAADILLADCGFCSFFQIANLLNRGVDVLTRLHQARSADMRKGIWLGPGDRLVTWKKPLQRTKAWTKKEFDALPDCLTLRMIRYYVSTPGFRTKKVILITTLLDPITDPASELAALYFQRWSVELHFREIKTLLAMDVLRCKTPKMVIKEVHMHRIAYNLIRTLMQEASLRHDVPLDRLSFKGTLDALHHFADAIQASAGKTRKQSLLLDTLLEIIAADVLPFRPDRVEPRAKKRRPKNYHLLTKPRRQMLVPPHRNRPKFA